MDHTGLEIMMEKKEKGGRLATVKTAIIKVK